MKCDQPQHLISWFCLEWWILPVILGGSLGLANGWRVIEFRVSTRRIGLRWEATRAPRWTRIPQAWAVSAAQAGLLRDRPQCDKSQGVRGTASPEMSELGYQASEWRQHAGQDLQAQILLVAQAIGTPLEHANLVVESLDETQGHLVLRLAKGGNAIPVLLDHAGELLVRFEPLPFEGCFPVL